MAIERRTPRTSYPARWKPVCAMGGVFGPVSGAVVAREPRTRRLMRATRARHLAPEVESM
jgi:hypothetical protein